MKRLSPKKHFAWQRELNGITPHSMEARLNMVEIELAVLANQCLNRRRIGDIDKLRQEIAAWEHARKAQKATVQWRFTPSAARTKLKHLYPLREETS
jgi:hypothetical protein